MRCTVLDQIVAERTDGAWKLLRIEERDEGFAFLHSEPHEPVEYRLQRRLDQISRLDIGKHELAALCSGSRDRSQCADDRFAWQILNRSHERKETARVAAVIRSRQSSSDGFLY
jgi:hypothetical protein